VAETYRHRSGPKDQWRDASATFGKRKDVDGSEMERIAQSINQHMAKIQRQSEVDDREAAFKTDETHRPGHHTLRAIPQSEITFRIPLIVLSHQRCLRGTCGQSGLRAFLCILGVVLIDLPVHPRDNGALVAIDHNTEMFSQDPHFLFLTFEPPYAATDPGVWSIPCASDTWIN